MWAGDTHMPSIRRKTVTARPVPRPTAVISQAKLLEFVRFEGLREPPIFLDGGPSATKLPRRVHKMRATRSPLLDGTSTK